MNLSPNFGVYYPKIPLPLFFIDYPTNYLDPTVLSMVCRRWREIAVGYHSLWTPILVRVSMMHLNDWKCWGFLQLRDRLEKSGAHPLTIRVETNHRGSDKYTGRISGIFDILNPHSTRWRSIEFGFTLKPKIAAKFALIPAPSLKHLGLRPQPRVDMKVLQNIRTSWKQISEITLDIYHFERKQELYGILSWLPVSLMALTFADGPYYLPAWDLSEHRRPIKLPNLRHLRFLRKVPGVLDMLICPLLERLDINEGDLYEVARFLDNSPCALVHIYLGNIQPKGKQDGLREYYEILQRLALSKVKSISLADLTDGVLDLLVLDSRGFFPFLETLHIDLASSLLRSDFKYITTQIKGIMNIEESRVCDADVDCYRTSFHSLAPNLKQTIIMSSTRNFSISVILGPHGYTYNMFQP